MIERLKREGKADAIPPEIEAIMDNFDGQVAAEIFGDRRVQDEPVLWCVGKDGCDGIVYESDCVDVS